MKYEVKLYVGGKVFTEEVQAANNQDAKYCIGTKSASKSNRDQSSFSMMQRGTV